MEYEGFADPHQRLVDEISPEALAEWKQIYLLFLKTLHALPERTRTIFILNRFENMPAREIAERLGYSQRLIEQEIARALSAIREKLP